ncbi:MAG: cell wall metabolism sensor histidine kinase WalK [Megasphaera sp.]|jgi:signal transduction histidine kinase|nr:cell wall metabolism sensor histidine kinase WalK [Megasphaera sp.]
MKLSIRKKVCLALVAFSLFCAITLALIIVIGFNPFYYQFKKNGMISVGQDVKTVYEQNGSDGFDDIDQISQEIGADIFIIDHGKLAYSSRPDRRVMMPPMHERKEIGEITDGRAEKEMHMQPPRHVREIMELLQGHEPNLNGSKEIQFYETQNHIKLLDLIYRVQDHTYLIISQPIAPIEESVQIAKQFVVICGILWLIVAVLGAFFFSRELTRPLLKLKKLAQGMTALDFSHKWDGKGDDEIGQLGNSLNALSDQLDTALSDLKETNKELQKQLDKANEVEHMRKQFISAVSHELKTPLAIIQGYAEGLDDLAFDDDTRNRYCRVIRSETEKMDRLVMDLLNLSRLETGSFRIEKTDFDFTALAEETKERFAGTIAEKKIHMQWDLPEEILVNGDPERIDQILNNYISNAIDYTESGKTIRISTEENQDTYTVSVYNQGIQIAPENQGRLWQAFFKVDSARTRTFGGHGLGLSIVAALVKLHEQHYGMYNAADGVVFWFTIAKAKASQAEAAIEQAERRQD